MYTKVESEPKGEVATIEREFKFRKRMALSVLGTLITVPFVYKFVYEMCD